jgi:chaperone required for assembly of F1-ATPase
VTEKPSLDREAPPAKPRRFYKAASVADEAGLWCVVLDGKPVHTPMRNLLGSPIRALADVLAAEWDAQDPVIDRGEMPITRLVSTAVDRIGPERKAVVDSLMSYIDSDLLCYRATYPTALKVRQADAWQPILDWLQEYFGAQFLVIEGVMPVQQPKETVGALRSAIESLSDERLTAFMACAAATKSLALSMAIVHSRLSAEDVAAYAHLDDSFQAEQWGEDQEALIRQRSVHAEIFAIGTYLSLLD